MSSDEQYGGQLYGSGLYGGTFAEVDMDLPRNLGRFRLLSSVRNLPKVR